VPDTIRTCDLCLRSYGDDIAFATVPNHWEQLLRASSLSDITPYVWRRSFASIANNLGFTEVTIAALTSAIVGCVAPDHFPAHYRGASMNLFERRIQAMLVVD
jgi:hypothetical protein